MSYTAWPTNAELLDELNRLGVPLPSDSSTVSNYVDQAVRLITPTIGVPFIEAASADLLRDAPYSTFLQLPCWYSAITAVAVGVSETDTTGTVLNIGTDVFLKKNRYGIIYGLEFVSYILGSQESIKITGTAGYADEIPADLWQGVMDYAVALAVQRNKAFAGDMRRLKQADSEIEFVAFSNPDQWLKERRDELMRVASFYRVAPLVY